MSSDHEHHAHHEHHEHNEHHDHEHAHDRPAAGGGITFNFEGSDYSVSLEAAQNAGLTGMTDRIELPSGQLVLLHPHAHADNANTPKSIREKGGKIWPVD